MIIIDRQATGKNLQDIRRKYGCSVKELANILCVEQFTIYAYESGRKMPSLDVFINMCHYYGCEWSDLIIYKGD